RLSVENHDSCDQDGELGDTHPIPERYRVKRLHLFEEAPRSIVDTEQKYGEEADGRHQQSCGTKLAGTPGLGLELRRRSPADQGEKERERQERVRNQELDQKIVERMIEIHVGGGRLRAIASQKRPRIASQEPKIPAEQAENAHQTKAEQLRLDPLSIKDLEF